LASSWAPSGATISNSSSLDPEMGHNERNEGAGAALEHERLRRKGVSLLEICMGRAKGGFKIAKVEVGRRKDVEAKGGLSSVPSNFLFRFGAF
jgi:hypothetical protein